MSSINKEYIDDLLKYGEHLNLECKESKNELPKSMTATKYLDMIVATGLLEKVKIKHINYYMNVRLIELFMNHELPVVDRNLEIIESVSPNQ